MGYSVEVAGGTPATKPRTLEPEGEGFMTEGGAEEGGAAAEGEGGGAGGDAAPVESAVSA